MTPRAQRRAAQRQEKLVANTNQNSITNTPESSSEPVARRVSEAQWIANRRNAQLSQGPISSEGKAKVSMNALRTGLTGKIVVLPSEDAVAYQEHIQRHFAQYEPVTPNEKELVQSIADTKWRLLRIVPLEASVLSIGRETCADFVADEPNADKRESDLQGHIFLTYRKELSNIALQERRLRNHLKADIAELEALQAERLKKEKDAISKRQQQLDRAARLLDDAKKNNIPVNDLAEFGFDFSISEMRAYDRKNAVYNTLTRGYNLNFDQFLTKYRAENPQTEAVAA